MAGVRQTSYFSGLGCLLLGGGVVRPQSCGTYCHYRPIGTKVEIIEEDTITHLPRSRSTGEDFDGEASWYERVSIPLWRTTVCEFEIKGFPERMSSRSEAPFGCRACPRLPVRLVPIPFSAKAVHRTDLPVTRSRQSFAMGSSRGSLEQCGYRKWGRRRRLGHTQLVKNERGTRQLGNPEPHIRERVGIPSWSFQEPKLPPPRSSRRRRTLHTGSALSMANCLVLESQPAKTIVPRRRFLIPTRKHLSYPNARTASPLEIPGLG